MPTKSALLAQADNVLLTPMSFRNKLINGNFDFWQRGFSQTDTGYGSDDRWANMRNGSTIVHTREEFATNQTAVPNFPRYYSRTVVTSVAGAANCAYKEQRIEDVSTLAGKRVAVTFWAKADSAKQISVNFQQRWGLAITQWMQPTKVMLSTSWAKYTVFADISPVPSFTGNRGALHVVFFFDAGSNFNSASDSLGQQSGTFELSQAQAEEGIPTPFEIRPYALELTLCQRYYEKTYDIDTPPGTATNIGALVMRQVRAGPGVGMVETFAWRYSVRKAVAVTPIIVNPVDGTPSARDLVAEANCASASEPGTMQGESGGHRTVGVATGSVAGNTLIAHMTVDAEI